MYLQQTVVLSHRSISHIKPTAEYPQRHGYHRPLLCRESTVFISVPKRGEERGTQDGGNQVLIFVEIPS